MRKNQVDALIDHARNDLVSIEDQYKAALTSTTISTKLQIDIKNYMENLRSALDYIAHDIYDEKLSPHRATTGQREISKIYFPYGRAENDFRSGIGSSLPDLGTVSPDLYNAIEAIQPYVVNDDWLYNFCNILNEKKHNELSPQTVEESRGLEIDFGGPKISMPPGASISGSGSISSGGKSVDLRNETVSGDSPASNTRGGVRQIVTRWVSFKFSDTGIEVLPLLKKAIAGIESVKNEVYKNLS